nr:unnamed protein product [Spirometra erinaceieuropaei]
MDLFSAAFENFGLVINTQKTVVMHQPPTNTATPTNAPQISVNGTQLQVVENFSIYTILRQKQLRWSGHLVRMDDERLPKRLFYGDVATGSRRQGGQIRRYKDTLKSSLKRLQINPTNWEELARDRPTWRRTVKTSAAIYEANRIAAVKANCEARKSQLRPVRKADAQPLPTCPRCQRTFRARIELVGHLRINCTSRTASTAAPPPSSSMSSLLPTTSGNSSEPHRMGLFGHKRIHESGIDPNSDTPTTLNTSTMPSPTLAPSPCALIIIIIIIITTTAASVADTGTPDLSCPHRPRTFTSRIGLVGHLRIHRTETGEPVPGAPTYTHHARLNCRTVLALSGIAWAYSVTCASTTTCGRQPPVTPHVRTLPSLLHHHHPHHTSTLTHRMHPTATSHASGKCASRLGPHAASAARMT